MRQFSLKVLLILIPSMLSYGQTRLEIGSSVDFRFINLDELNTQIEPQGYPDLAGQLIGGSLEIAYQKNASLVSVVLASSSSANEQDSVSSGYRNMSASLYYGYRLIHQGIFSYFPLIGLSINQIRVGLVDRTSIEQFNDYLSTAPTHKVLTRSMPSFYVGQRIVVGPLINTPDPVNMVIFTDLLYGITPDLGKWKTHGENLNDGPSINPAGLSIRVGLLLVFALKE